MTALQRAHLACDTEPIHVPGAIQPHGVLVAVDTVRLEIAQVSGNSARFFGVAPESVLGKPLSALMGKAAEPLLAAVGKAHGTIGEPLLVEVHGVSFDALVHRHQGMALLELEPHDGAAAPSDTALRGALARLQRPTSVHEVCAVAVDELRKITGFDRVLLYRFDAEGHGDVLEESRAGDVHSYRGLRFPASDIPRQAREMYLLDWLRLIPDARYLPVPLVPQLRPDSGAPLDLSFAMLRSVSPVHLEYLANMGVGASMSISLIRGDALWGLVSCHHRSARHVGQAVRSACEVIGRVVSLQLAALDELEARTLQSAVEGYEARLVDAMRDAPEETASALVQRSDALLALVDAAGAAVCTPSGMRTVGATPPAARITELLAWLARERPARVLHSEALAELHPPAAEYAHLASGLLALALPGVPASYVLWFRPELVRTVTWAGDPTTAVNESATGPRPRVSFEAWKQVVRGRARAWRPVDIHAAEGLRRRIIELDLSRQMARAEQAVRHRDEMVAVLSHDLKNPLGVVQLSVAVLAKIVAGDSRADKTLALVQSAVDRMNALVMNLLDLSKIEAGRFEVSPRGWAASHLVSDAFVILAPLADAKGVRLSTVGDDVRVLADAERIFQVLSNLVGNAIKFTPTDGAVVVEVHPEVAGAVRFSVVDSGPGIAPIEMAHVFDRYWQARRGRSAGAGLGLYIAKGIVEAHGGRIWAESAVGAGATFHFTLPVAPVGSPRPEPPAAVTGPPVPSTR